MSPRNTAVAVVDMLEKTSCHRIIVNHAVASLMESVKVELSTQGGHQVEETELSSFYDIFPELRRRLNGQDMEKTPNVLPYPNLVSARSMDEPVLYLHSSGSTGFPKPLAQSHTTMVEWGRDGMYDTFEIGFDTVGLVYNAIKL